MRHLFLPDVEIKAGGGKYSQLIEKLQTKGAHVSRIRPEGVRIA